MKKSPLAGNPCRALSKGQYARHRSVISGNRFDADDFMQDSCVEALELVGTGQFTSLDDALTHLLAVKSTPRRRDCRTTLMSSSALDQHRSNRTLWVDQHESSSTSDDPWVALETAIPTKLTEIARQRIDERLTNRQIAERTGLHVKTVGYRYEEFVRRARKTLAPIPHSVVQHSVHAVAAA